MEKLQVSFIVEILGKPKEHVADALVGHIDKLKAEKGVKITQEKIHEPVLVKESKEMYTTFAEITAELESISQYFLIIFNYFPSNIEIIYPEKLKIDSHYLNEVGGALVQRLHEYDSLAKKLVADNQILQNMIMKHAPHLFKKKENVNEDKNASLQESAKQEEIKKEDPKNPVKLSKKN